MLEGTEVKTSFPLTDEQEMLTASFRKNKDEVMACSLHLDFGTRLSGALQHSGKHVELHISAL